MPAGTPKNGTGRETMEQQAQPADMEVSESVMEELPDSREEESAPGKQMHPLIKPKDYPSGVREWAMTAPAEMQYSAVAVALADVSPYLANYRLNYVYDNRDEPSAILLQVIVQGEQSSGKKYAWRITKRMLRPIQQRDEMFMAKAQEYKALMRRKNVGKGKGGKKDELPPEPLCPLTIVPEKLSITELFVICDAAVKSYGRTLINFQFADEIDTIVAAGRQSFSDLTQVYKVAWDLGTKTGQAYRSENSYNATVDVCLSYVFCGTPNAVGRFMNNAAVEGGNVTRVVLVMLESHLGCNPPQFKDMTAEQEASLNETLTRLMDLCYGPDGKLREETLLGMHWLYKPVKQWCDGVREYVSTHISRAMDTFYKRSSVSAFRMAAALQVLYELEGKKSQREIHRLVKQSYLAFADRILHNMLLRWGDEFEQASACNNRTRFTVTDYFRELPDRFSKEILVGFLEQKGIVTDARQVAYRWRKMGLLEEFRAGTGKIYVKTNKGKK